MLTKPFCHFYSKAAEDMLVSAQYKSVGAASNKSNRHQKTEIMTLLKTFEDVEEQLLPQSHFN